MKKEDYLRSLDHMSIFLDIHHFTEEELRELHYSAMQFVYNCEYQLDKLKRGENECCAKI